MFEPAEVWQATIIREDRGEAMAIAFEQNNFSVKIEEKTENGTVLKDYTANVPFPIKVSELLDEQLDEGSITVFHVKREIFAPFTKVVISLEDNTYAEKNVEPLSDISLRSETKGTFPNRYKVWTAELLPAYYAHSGISKDSIYQMSVTGIVKDEEYPEFSKRITVESSFEPTKVTFETAIEETFTLESATVTVEESHDKTFFVATDKADEKPVGSGYFNHELYLIEETKWLERFLIPATGFVNALGRNYTD